MTDPRVPVLVGAGQLSLRGTDVPSPREMMAAAVRAAAEDAGALALAGRADVVGVVDPITWPVADPAAGLAAAIGASPAATWRTVVGGNGPIALLGAACAAIAAGEADVVVLAGGEAMGPHLAALKSGGATGWAEDTADGAAGAPSKTLGTDREAHHPAETAAGLIAPIFYYPLFEQAVRGAAGRDVAAHQAWLGRLWERFNVVARDNPYAWSPEPMDAAAIATPSPANRAVSFPYTKVMNANIQVDQAAALIVCSAEAAAAAGVPRDRWVFVVATAGAHHHWHVVHRDRLDRSPAIAACGAAVLGHAGASIGDVEHLDLYSCFPSAVQVAATELGIDLATDGRPPTVTGGLAFAGGPANNYVTHALAALVGRVRETGGRGLSTAVGWYLTKHGAALLSAEPPSAGFAHHDVQATVDATPSREAAEGFAGRAPVEAYTALYDRDGTPTLGIVSAILPDGRRALAQSQDRPTVAALLDGDALGREVAFDGPAFTQ